MSVAIWLGVAFVALALALVFALLAGVAIISVEVAWREIRDRKARARRVEEQPPRVRSIIGGPDHG